MPTENSGRHRLPPTYNIEFYRGDTFPPVTFVVPFSIISAKVKLIGVKDSSQTIALLDSTLVVNPGIVFSTADVDAGKTKLTWRALTLAEYDKIIVLGGANYDLEVTISIGVIRTIVRGKITVIGDIT